VQIELGGNCAHLRNRGAGDRAGDEGHRRGEGGDEGSDLVQPEAQEAPAQRYISNRVVLERAGCLVPIQSLLMAGAQRGMRCPSGDASAHGCECKVRRSQVPTGAGGVDSHDCGLRERCVIAGRSVGAQKLRHATRGEITILQLGAS